MYHSITFKEPGSNHSWNTYDDFFLVPKSRPLLAPPTLKEEKVDIPGRLDGPLDYTGVLNGFRFDYRSGTWEFYVLKREPRDGAWQDLYSSILSTLHGKDLYVILEDDPLHYYKAYIEVGAWRTAKDYSSITIAYRAMPKRYNV